MNENSYQLPGWAAITAAVLALPTIVVGMMIEISMHTKPALAKALLLPDVLLMATMITCALYALARFRSFLNLRFDFHEVDGLIVAIVIGSALLATVSMVGRIAVVLLGLGPKGAVPFIAAIAVIGVPLSILSIVFAVKLLHLGTDLGGFKKPFAYTTIAAAICFATLILAPLGMVIDAASNVILGMIFLRRESSPAPEYV